jgi:hypothetical protein
MAKAPIIEVVNTERMANEITFCFKRIKISVK